MALLIPLSVRRRIERRIIAAALPPDRGGFIFEWLPLYGVFIAIMARDNVSWSNGHTACLISPHDAVKMELLIAEKTAPIIDQLQATARPCAKPLKLEGGKAALKPWHKRAIESLAHKPTHGGRHA